MPDLPARNDLLGWYQFNRISVDGFNCWNRDVCASAASEIDESLHHGSECYLGSRYGEPFPIVALSASGTEDSLRLDDSDMEHGLCGEGPQNPHMRGTLAVLTAVLERLPLDFEVFRHFALTRAAKCTLKHREPVDPPISAKPPRLCFEKCRDYVMPELSMLKPALVFTQGKEAREALWFEGENQMQPLSGDTVARLIAQTGAIQEATKRLQRGLILEHLALLPTGKSQAICLSLPHPSERSGRWWYQQRTEILGFLAWAARMLVTESR